MRLPSIRIGLDDNGGVCVDDDLASGPRMLDLPLPTQDCSTERFDATAARLGELVLTLLMQHRELPDLPATAAGGARGPALLGTAHDLIQHSLQQRTSLHVRSIDCLAEAMGESAPERAFVQQVWPRMRQRLLALFEPLAQPPGLLEQDQGLTSLDVTDD